MIATNRNYFSLGWVLAGQEGPAVLLRLRRTIAMRLRWAPQPRRSCRTDRSQFGSPASLSHDSLIEVLVPVTPVRARNLGIALAHGPLDRLVSHRAVQQWSLSVGQEVNECAHQARILPRAQILAGCGGGHLAYIATIRDVPVNARDEPKNVITIWLGRAPPTTKDLNRQTTQHRIVREIEIAFHDPSILRRIRLADHEQQVVAITRPLACRQEIGRMPHVFVRRNPVAGTLEQLGR